MRMRDGLGLQINRKNERWGEEGSHGSLHLTKMCQCQSCCHRVRGVCWAREPGHVGGTCRNLRSITLLSIAEFLVLPTFPPYSICPFIQKPHPKLPPQSPPCRFSCHLTYPLKLPQIHFPSLFYLSSLTVSFSISCSSLPSSHLSATHLSTADIDPGRAGWCYHGY